MCYLALFNNYILKLSSCQALLFLIWNLTKGVRKMNRIKELRKERDMTQEELGELLGVKRATVSKYENEQMAPSIDVLKKLSEIFSVSINYILGYKLYSDSTSEKFNKSLILTDKEAKVVEATKGLDDKSMQTAVEFLKLFNENIIENKKRSMLSDDELELINNYRFLDEGRKQRARGMLDDLRLAASNAKTQDHVGGNSNIDHVEIGGNVLSPTNITTNQTAG